MNKEEFLSLSLIDLSVKTGINKGTLSKYFSAHNPETPTWKNIEKIAKAFNTTAEDVMQLIKAKRFRNFENLKAKVANAKQNLLETA